MTNTNISTEEKFKVNCYTTKENNTEHTHYLGLNGWWDTIGALLACMRKTAMCSFKWSTKLVNVVIGFVEVKAITQTTNAHTFDLHILALLSCRITMWLINRPAKSYQRDYISVLKEEVTVWYKWYLNIPTQQDLWHKLRKTCL